MPDEEDKKFAIEHIGQSPLKNLNVAKQNLGQTFKKVDDVSAPYYGVASLLAPPSISFFAQRIARSKAFQGTGRLKALSLLPRCVAGGISLLSASHSFSLANKETDKSKRQYNYIDGTRAAISIFSPYISNVAHLPQEALYTYNSIYNKKNNNPSQDHDEDAQIEKFQHAVRLLSGVSGIPAVGMMGSAEKAIMNNIIKKYANSREATGIIKQLPDKALKATIATNGIDAVIDTGAHKSIANFFSDYRDCDSLNDM